MASEDSKPLGLLGSLRRVLDTLLETLQTRIELFATEFEEQRQLWVKRLVLAVVAAFMGVMGLLLTTVAIVWAVPAHWRLPVVAAMGLGCLAGAGVIFLLLRGEMQRAPKPFAETTAQLEKDRAWVKTLE